MHGGVSTTDCLLKVCQARQKSSDSEAASHQTECREWRCNTESADRSHQASAAELWGNGRCLLCSLQTQCSKLRQGLHSLNRRDKPTTELHHKAADGCPPELQVVGDVAVCALHGRLVQGGHAAQPRRGAVLFADRGQNGHRMVYPARRLPSPLTREAESCHGAVIACCWRDRAPLHGASEPSVYLWT